LEKALQGKGKNEPASVGFSGAVPLQNAELSFLIDEYSDLEVLVRGLIWELCRPFCGKCEKPCCREDICRETLDSLWLRMVWESKHLDSNGYDESNGWLTVDGCALETGRDPLCYEFFCSKIMSSFAGEYQRYGVNVLGNLISFVGRDALGKRHLVTLADPEELLCMNYGKIYERILKAHDALDDCICLIRNDSACDSILRNLQSIQRVPKGLS
jgi:hypothetical protein